MPLSQDAALERARKLEDQGAVERRRLDDVRRYWKGRQRPPAVIPRSAPAEVRTLARMSRVNIIDLVVESLAQSLAVEGFRASEDATDDDVWLVWQANQMDAHQALLHRACLAYGVAYAVVTPGEPVPVIRGLSPRKLVAMYGELDPEWPAYALERQPTWGTARLYEPDAIHVFDYEQGKFTYRERLDHAIGHVPVVRYLEVQDPDWDDEPTDESYPSAYMRERQVIGQVGALMPLQDQIDLITFNLLVAQHYAAFRQRYIIGWLAQNEETRMKMGASTLWTFEDDPTKIKIGDLEATELNGYLSSRESSFRQGASLSQTPAHELIGELVNLSAEALAAAEAGRDRKVKDRQTTLGEAHEQMLGLAARLQGSSVPDDAQVVWRDTTARSLSATVDALGKAAQMLDVPKQELWERIPGTTQADVKRWRAAAEAEPEEPVALPMPTGPVMRPEVA